MLIKTILAKNNIIPVVTLNNVEDAVPLAQAFMHGGIRAIEITLRTAVALSAIERIAKHCPDLSIAAGTVRTAEQLEQAQQAGAHFAVSPGLTDALANAAHQLNMPLLPGAITPSEIMFAESAGFSLLKCFPAHGLLDGVAYLKSLSGPFANIIFCPTGGINATNYLAYLSLSNVIAVGGSWFVTQEHLKHKQWDVISQNVRDILAHF